MRKPSARYLLGSAFVLSFTSVASAQGIFVQQAEMVAVTGDSVPNTSLGETFGGSATFDTGLMDDQGMVFFRGRITGGGAATSNERALFYGSSRSNLTMVVRGGDSEPTGTLPGVTLNSSSGSQGLGGSLRLAKDGRMMWSSSLFGPGISTSNDTAVFVGTPGNFQILVREGDLAPSGGATITSSFSSISQQNTSMNSSGTCLIKVTLSGGDVIGTTNNEAWLYGTPGNLQFIARKGDVAPGGEVLAGVSPSFVSQMNEAGQVMFDVSFVAGTGTNPVTTANDRALWRYTPGVGNEQLIREGDASPIPGVTFNNAANTWSINTGATTFNAAGDVLLRTDLAGAVTAGVDDSAIVLATPSGVSVVVRRNDPIDALPGLAFDAFNNTSLQLSNSGRIAFQCSMFGATTADDTAYFSGTPGNWELVLREGAAAPGFLGYTFQSVSGVSVMSNAKGQLIMAAGITDTVTPISCQWGWSPGLGLQLIAASGDVIETSIGTPHTVGSSSGVQFSNGDGRPMTFANNGDFTQRVNFQDGTSAIVTSHLGSFAGLPATLTAAGGGVHNMFLNAGPDQAGNSYLVLGSVTGTSPGLTVGPYNLPINPDFYFNITIQFANTALFVNTLSQLDSLGRATATLLVPPAIPGLAGITMNHAFLGFNNFGAIKFASEADSLTFTP